MTTTQKVFQVNFSPYGPHNDVDLNYDQNYDDITDNVFGIFSSREKALEALQEFSNNIDYSMVEHTDFSISEKTIDTSTYLMPKHLDNNA